MNLTAARRRDHFKCALIASIHYTITITSSSSLEQPLASRASNEGYPKVPEDFTIMEKAHTKGPLALLHLKHY